MHFSIPKAPLVAALTRCAAIAGSKTTTPILEQVLIDPRANALHIEATDLEIGYHTVVDGIIWLCDMLDSYARFTLSAKKMLEIVKAIPVTMVDFQLDSAAAQTFIISGGTASFTIAGLDPSEYPVSPDITGSSITIPAGLLHQALAPVNYCQSKDAKKINLNGTWFKLEENLEDAIFITTAATDGHRLCLNTIPIPGGEDDEALDYLPELAKGITIPGKAVTEILALDIKTGADEDGNTLAVITIANNKLCIHIGHERLTISLLAEDYPDINRVIPTGHTGRAIVKRQALIDAITRVKIATDKENLRGINLAFADDTIILDSSIPMIGLEARDRVTAELIDPPETVRISAEYLLQALANIPQTNIEMLFVDPLSPITIVPSGTDFPQAIIMPMRGA